MIFQIIASCQTTTPIESTSPSLTTSDIVSSQELPLVISTSQLKDWPEYLSTPKLVSPVEHPFLVLDTRSQDLYLESHIPNSINLDVNLTWDSNFMLLPIKEIEALLSQTGISQEHTIVVYDAGDLKNSARMFWLLESHGHENIHVLDGGIAAWQSHHQPTTSKPTYYKPNNFIAKIRPQSIATKFTVHQAINNSQVTLIDARPNEEYLGQVSPAGKTGRIPSSINIPWSKIIKTQDGYNTFKNNDELSKEFSSLPQKSDQIITYCNKGKQSAVSYLGLRIAGYNVAAYDGSWFEWSHDPILPIE